MVGKRRERFFDRQTRLSISSSGRAGKVSKGVRGTERSGGRGGAAQGIGGGGMGARDLRHEFDEQPRPPRRGGVLGNRRRQPQNPHDPTSKDPFMRAGIGLGTNDTKIFTRAGMSMDLKKMRKMF